MNVPRFAWGIGLFVFALALGLGWVLFLMPAMDVGFIEWSSIIHAALGLGLFSGFMSYVGMTAYAGRRI